MDASFTPRAQNFVELGGGFATDVGPRIQAKWNKPWVNSSGHSLTSSISLSAPEQIIDTSYRIPLKVNPIEQYYAVSGGYKRTDLNDTKADTATVSVSRNWDLSTGWQYGINMRWSLSHFTRRISPTPPCCSIRGECQPCPFAGRDDAILGRQSALLSGCFQ